MRLHLKVKSQESGQPAVKKRCFQTVQYNSVDDAPVTPEDVERHVKELQTEWNKKEANRSTDHVKALLRSTRQDRIDLLSKTPNGSISAIYKKYPCFEDSNYVSNY